MPALSRSICIRLGSTAFVAAALALPVGGLFAKEDLAKASQNPIGDVINLPVQNTTYFDMGPADKTYNVTNIQPVYPVSFGRFNLINRAIVPVVYLEGQGDITPPDRPPVFGGGESLSIAKDDEFGLGNITYQAFLSPATPGRVIWGVGPVLELPTNTDDTLGQDAWSAGPGFVVLAMPGQWVIGALAYNLWSFAEDDNATDEVNKLVAQYFINYNFGGGWYATSTPVISADWEADSDNRWTVPVGGGLGRIVNIGKRPVDFKGQLFYNAEGPKFVGDWSFQFQVKWLFPK